MDPVQPSVGQYRVSPNDLRIRAGNTDCLTLTRDTLTVNVGLAGDGVDNLLDSIGAIDGVTDVAKLTEEVTSITTTTPGSFTVDTTTFRTQWGRLQLTGSQRATLSTTGRLIISDALTLAPSNAATIAANAVTYTATSPSSFTVLTQNTRTQWVRLQLRGTSRATLRGTARLRISDALVQAASLNTLTTYAPGSFTVLTENFRCMSRHLKLFSNQRATLQGTATLRID